jgi:predicted NAD-dependent protein-ADP-ribosyltransferase YbiA (DUF1768 family)
MIRLNASDPALFLPHPRKAPCGWNTAHTYQVAIAQRIAGGGEVFVVRYDPVKDALFSFTGRNQFLSNSYECLVQLDGVDYPMVEHAYQAAKTLDADERARIRELARPEDAITEGRRVTLRPDWEMVRINQMEELLRKKFEDAKLRKQIDTGRKNLINGTEDHGDLFWGWCRCPEHAYRDTAKISSASF